MAAAGLPTVATRPAEQLHNILNKSFLSDGQTYTAMNLKAGLSRRPSLEGSTTFGVVAARKHMTSRALASGVLLFPNSCKVSYAGLYLSTMFSMEHVLNRRVREVDTLLCSDGAYM